MNAPVRAPGCADPGIGFHAFVALIACLMATTALGIDTMLPALPEIGRSLHVSRENHRQLIISTYMFGFGIAQIVYGPLADRYGRKPILLTGVALSCGFALLAGLAQTFPLMLAARLLQGIAAAAARVLVISIVRDCYAGRQMARVMSLSFIVFLAVPVLAPTIGQAVLLVASWRAIFLLLAAFSAATALVTWLRLNETLHPEYRQPLSLARIGQAMRTVATGRITAGYTLANTLLYGAMSGFINSIQQVFGDIFRRPAMFPIVFACIAGTMAVFAFANSRIVERFGTRRVSHSAMLGFVAFSGVHVAFAASGHESIASFAILQALTLGCFSLIGSNFNSMAMEPVAHIAGTAASVQGFFSTSVGALIGLGIGQSFDGTTLPLALGFLTMGSAVIGIVLFTERGRLFRPHHATAA